MVRAEVLVVVFSRDIYWYLYEVIYMFRQYDDSVAGRTTGLLCQFDKWKKKEHAIVCLAMICLVWLAVPSSSYFVAVECFYGNGGGLSPCAHTLPRDPRAAASINLLSISCAVPIDHDYDYSPPPPPILLLLLLSMQP